MTPGLDLELVGAFTLRAERGPVLLPPSCQRLVALLAFSRCGLRRSDVADLLWPDVSSRRGEGNLRSVVWRLRRNAPDLVVADTAWLRLDSALRIDFWCLVEGLRSALGAGGSDRSVQRSMLGGALLPGWDEPWLVVPRERLRQLRLHAGHGQQACPGGASDRPSAERP